MNQSSSLPPIVAGADQVADSVGLEDLVRVVPVDGAWRNRTCLLNVGGQVLGGQLAAHCLMAAAAESPDSVANSIQVTFVSAADPGQEFRVGVTNLRDGRRLAHRQVQLEQGGRVAVSALVTLRFSATPASPSMAIQNCTMPCVPPPEKCPLRHPEAAEGDPLVIAVIGGHPYFEIRSTDGYRPGDTQSDQGRAWYWLRMCLAAGLPAATQQGLLTLASDFWFTLPLHGAAPRPWRPFATTSLDHTIWFHRAHDLAEWVLVETQCQQCDPDLGLIQARYWTREGQLVATIMQQALVRHIPQPNAI